MRSTEKYHPLWGAAGFVRTARVVLVATTVGAIVGVGAGVTLVRHPSSETSVAPRALAFSDAATPVRSATPPVPSQTEGQAELVPTAKGPGEDVVIRSWSPSSIAETKSAGQFNVSSAPKRAFSARSHVVHFSPIKPKPASKPNASGRYASHHENVGLAPGKYYMKGSSDQYRSSEMRGGYYRESRHSGGYYVRDGDRAYEDW